MSVVTSNSGSTVTSVKSGEGSSKKSSKKKGKEKTAAEKAKDDAIQSSMELFFDEKRLQRKRAKEAKSVLNNSWFDKRTLDDGKEMYGNLTDQFEKVNRILQPVINKKRFVQELDAIRAAVLATPNPIEREISNTARAWVDNSDGSGWALAKINTTKKIVETSSSSASSCDTDRSWGNDSCVCWRVLHLIHPPHGTLRQKRMIILWRASVINELKNKFHIVTPHFRDIRALELMDRQHLKLSIIDPSLMRNFRAQRIKYWTEMKQLKKVEAAQTSLDKIFVCKSLLHYEASGCPTCGVVFIGTSKTLAPFVKKVDRWTGVQTLVPLAFELETLKGELDEQSKLCQSLYDEMQKLEIPLRLLVCRNIQAWYAFKSAKWMKMKQEVKRARSLKMVRLRMLKLVKKYVDEMCEKHPDILSVDLYKYPDPGSGLAIKFSLYKHELEEYVAERARRRFESTTALAKLMIEKLKFKVNRTRHKKFLEIQKQKEDDRLFMERTKATRDAKALHLLRKKIEILDRRKFICRRPSCDGRFFLSKDRFEVHCKIHKYNDQIRSAHLVKVKQVFDDRVKVETSMIDRINESRLNLELSDIYSMESEELKAIQEAEKRFNAPSAWAGFDVVNDKMQIIHPQTAPMLTYPNPNPKPNLDLLQGKFSKSIPMAGVSFGDSHETLAYNSMNRVMFHLELVSKHGDVDGPYSFPLKDPLVRVGTMIGCELLVTLTGKARAEARLSKIHCIIQCFDNTVLDNSSKYGTYVVDEGGVSKVSSVISHPLPLRIGNLLCFGVKEDGPSAISATEAGESALVYRICSFVH